MFTALVVLGDSSNSTDFVSVVVIAALFYSFAFVIKCPDSKHLMEHGLCWCASPGYNQSLLETQHQELETVGQITSIPKSTEK